MIDALLALLADQQAPIATRIEGGHVLGRLGDPRLLDLRTGEAEGQGQRLVPSYWCAVEAGPFWYGDDRVDKDEDAEAGDESSAEAEMEASTDDEVVISRAPRFDPSKLRQVTLPACLQDRALPGINAEFQRFIEDSGL